MRFRQRPREPEPARRAHDLLAQLLGRYHGVQLLPELPDEIRVGERPVACRRRERVPLDQRVEPMARLAREKRARQPHRAKHVGIECDARSLELRAQKASVEARVVRDEKFAVEPLEQCARNVGKRRRAAHHRVGDTRELLDERGNRLLRIDERRPCRYAVRVHDDNADFGDAMLGGRSAGGFEVDERERRVDRGMRRRRGGHGMAGGASYIVGRMRGARLPARAVLILPVRKTKTPA